MLGVLVLARPASAQSIDIVVFGPINDGDATTTNAVADALRNANVGTRSATQIDAGCATKPECLAAAGAESGGRRALALTVAAGKITFVLVDVADKEIISTSTVTIAPRKLARDFGKTLKKFIIDAPTDRAKALFAIGNRHYELGEYKQALEIYKKAYRVRPLPAFQFNIAQCHRKLDQHTEAIQMYQAYLVGVPRAANKALVESLIDESRSRIEAAEKAARDAEQARLDAEKKTAEDARKAKEAEAAAKQASAAAEAERRKQLQAKLDAERQRELDKEYNRHPARKWMLATGALGLAAAGVGGYFAYRVRTRQSDYDDTCADDPLIPEPTRDSCLADIDAGRRDARLANVLIGAGGGIVLASMIVFIIDPGNIERPSQQRATISITPTSVQAVIRW